MDMTQTFIAASAAAGGLSARTLGILGLCDED
jgi:hypothetical protein